MAWHHVDVTVALPGHGNVPVATGVEPDGPEAYTVTGRTLEATGERFQVGCDVYATRRWTETLERPDGSLMSGYGGAAPAVLAGSCRDGRFAG